MIGPWQRRPSWSTTMPPRRAAREIADPPRRRRRRSWPRHARRVRRLDRPAAARRPRRGRRSRGTSSASGRSTSAWRPTAIPTRNANQLADVPGTHHLMPVTAADLAAAAAEYAAGLPDRFDVVHLGMGPDGHTASWPPGDPVIDSAKAVDLSRPYQGHVRMTLTPPVVERGARPASCSSPAPTRPRPWRAGWRATAPACRSPGSAATTRSSCSTRGRRRPPRQPDERLTRRREARRRLLDDASSAVGDAGRAHAAAAQRREPVGHRRALPDRSVGGRRSTSSPTPTATCASASSCPRAR